MQASQADPYSPSSQTLAAASQESTEPSDPYPETSSPSHSDSCWANVIVEPDSEQLEPEQESEESSTDDDSWANPISR